MALGNLKREQIVKKNLNILERESNRKSNKKNIWNVSDFKNSNTNFDLEIWILNLNFEKIESFLF